MKKKYKVIVFDEAQTEISNRAWQSLTNKLMNYLLSTFRHRNVILLFTSPYSDFLDSQAMKLIHCKFEVRSHDQRTKLTKIRPKILQYNSKLKKFYEHSLYVIRDNRYNKLVFWGVKKPPQHLIDPYEEDKLAFTTKLNKSMLEDMDKLEKGEDKVEENQEFLLKLNNDELDFYNFVKDNPNKTQTEYAKELGLTTQKASRFVLKIEKYGGYIRKYLGKPDFLRNLTDSSKIV